MKILMKKRVFTTKSMKKRQARVTIDSLVRPFLFSCQIVAGLTNMHLTSGHRNTTVKPERRGYDASDKGVSGTCRRH